MSNFQYQKLVQQLIRRIETKQLAFGEKLPSIRSMATKSSLSKTTVIKAYEQLESQGYIQAVAKSGFYVSYQLGEAVEQLKKQPKRKRPQAVQQGQVMLDMMRKGAAFDLLPSEAVDHVNPELRNHLSKAFRYQSGKDQQQYDEPSGYRPLRKQLALHYTHNDYFLEAKDIIVTHGCQHSLHLALMASTEPGDVVAIESPAFYGVIELLRALKLKVLEIPCSSITGIKIEEFVKMCERWPIKALMLTSNFSTPTGSVIPDAQKQHLLELSENYDFTIIEDDIYRLLYFGHKEPNSLLSFNPQGETGNVISCSSFSKSLSRDLRVGWIISNKFHEKIEQLKFSTSLATGRTMQVGLSNYLKSGAAKRFMNKRRSELQQYAKDWRDYLTQDASPIISCSTAQGGLSLWVELPEHVNTLALYNEMQKQQIYVTPGSLFSLGDEFNQFLRISFSEPLNEARKEALELLLDYMKK